MKAKTASEVQTAQREITPAVINSFGLVSGDMNPLHMDEEAAKEGPFGERIAHGMFGASLISAALADLDGDVIYMEQNLQFEAPVFIGDTITAEVVTEEVSDNGVTKVSTTVVNQDDEVVIDGTATVMIE